MAIGRNNLKNLEKSAANYLYAFIPSDHRGFSQDVYAKRDKQRAELKKIYAYNQEVSIDELRNIVYNGIVKRYGKTPYKLINEIVLKSNRTPLIAGIGNVMSDAESAKAVEAIATTVSEGGTKKKKNLWKDIFDVLQFLLDFINKIFGKYTDPEVYSPISNDWTGDNRSQIEGVQMKDKDLQTTSSVMPLLLIGGAGYLMMNKKKKPKPKRRKKTNT